MAQPPEYIRRAAGRDRIANITAVFRAAFPGVPEEVVAGYLRGEEILSLTRTARRIIAFRAADYDAAIASLIAGQPVYSLGVCISDFDEGAVAASLERRQVGVSGVAFGRVVSRIANGGRGT